MDNFHSHCVKIRKTKANKKALPDWDLSRAYQVLMMNSEKLTVDVNELPKKLKKKNTTGLVPLSFDVEDDDDDDSDGTFENPTPQMVTIRRVWLLLASPECGGYAWMTTEDVRFISADYLSKRSSDHATPRVRT